MDASIISSWTATLQPFSTIATIIISLIALGFGLFNFWYGNLRRGKIIVSDPLSYAMVFESDKPKSEDKLMMFIPMIFLNEGNTTQFVQDMRLILHQNENKSNELFFGRSYSSWEDNRGMLAQQFPIEGHRAYSANFMFYQKPGGFIPEEGNCRAEIKAKRNGMKWETIHEFTFRIYPNQKFDLIPRHCDPEMKSYM